MPSIDLESLTISQLLDLFPQPPKNILSSKKITSANNSHLVSNLDIVGGLPNRIDSNSNLRSVRTYQDFQRPSLSTVTNSEHSSIQTVTGDKLEYQLPEGVERKDYVELFYQACCENNCDQKTLDSLFLFFKKLLPRKFVEMQEGIHDLIEECFFIFSNYSKTNTKRSIFSPSTKIKWTKELPN